jgi:hypothetical protein
LYVSDRNYLLATISASLKRNPLSHVLPTVHVTDPQ